MVISGFALLWRIRFVIYNDLYFPLLSLYDVKTKFSISELEELQQHILTLQDNEKKLAINASLGKIATQVAHDIRGPLSSMDVALSGLVKVKSQDPNYLNYLNILELASKRLQGTADGLLKKREEGEEKEAVLFSLHYILDELVGEYQTQEQYRKILFKKEYLSQSIQLHGDPTKLQRAFGNIVKNAVEAMKGEGTITVRTRFNEKKSFPQDVSGNPMRSPITSFGDDRRVVISLTDTGPGMGSATLSKVLKGGYTEGKADGHGIGMQVVREVANDFGGEITAESQLGQGTTFHFKLPLPSKDLITTAIRDESALEKFEIKIERDSSDSPQNDFRILVVDDDPSMRALWKMLLEEQGVTPIVCESYEDVERKLGDEQITTAVVDYHYDNSVHNGADVIRYLKTKGLKYLYLCTAEYWKPEVKRLAEELEIKICPKPLPKITICHREPEGRGDLPKALSVGDCFVAEAPRNDKQSTNGKGLSVLVIDDDPLIGLSWRSQKGALKIGQLQIYSNMEKCTSNGVMYSDVDIAFIDKNIPETTWELSKTISYLKEKGVKKVVIASGESSADLKKDVACQHADHILSEKIPRNLKEFL